MRLSYNWLKEYIDCGLSPRELAEKLTLSGIEVEAVEAFRPRLPRVVAAAVMAVKPHPGSSKLSLVTVDPGVSPPLNIVCGAPNVAVGQKVPLALSGAVLPGIGRIETATILGEKSEGMLCSPRELGLDLGEAAEAGILVLDPATAPGTAVDEVLEFDDPILYLSLTPNRADCMGMLGVAYEVAALTGAVVKLPPEEPPQSEESVHSAVQVNVLEPELCPRYTARVIREVATGPAPLWMQLRLLKAGIRPINNIVDITNYVMWEYGQPLHAFDYDLLAAKEIIVRRAAAGETLVTLDGITRELDEEALVIADPGGPIGLAGVMGGESTEINPRTRTVLLEAAMFNPASIRRTARRYNLPSEASQRFERGVNPGATLAAQNRAALLLARYTGGHVMKGVVDTNPVPPEPRRITVRPHRINEILGVKIPVSEVTEILARLDFGVARGSGGVLELTVPLRRGDVLIEEDVVEEVARIYGYERIPLTLPRGELLSSRETKRQQIHSLVRQTLVGCGFFEAITLSFINRSHLERLRLEENDPRRRAIALQNPLSEEQGVMRTTLLPGLFKVLQHNFNHQEMNQLFFEIGAVFLPRRLPLDELPQEPLRLALAATGQLPDPNWLTAPSPADFYLVKGALEMLCSRLHISGMELVPAALPFLHPTRSAAVVIGGTEIGFIGEVHPEVAETWDFRQPVTICELDLDALAEAAVLVPRLSPLPRYPAAWRDLAVVVSREIPAGELERRIREAGGELLEQVVLFDLYEGEQVPPGKRSIAYSLTFRRPEGTLTDEEVQAALERVERALAQLGASLRR